MLHLHQCLLAPSQRNRPQLAMGSSGGEDLVVFSTCEVRDRLFDSRKDQLQKGLGYLFIVSKPNLGALEQS